jgi:hypothetical protein
MKAAAEFEYFQLVCMRGYRLSRVRDWPDFGRGRHWEKNDLLVVPNGGHTACIDVFGKVPDLFRRFASWNATPQSILEFTNSFGVIERATLPLRPRGNLDNLWRLFGGISIKRWVSQQEVFADYLRGLKRQKTTRQRRFNLLGNCRFLWEFDRNTSSMSLIVKPESLLGALYCQAFLAEFVRPDDRVCEHCEAVFSVGSRSAKRSDAKFCSRKCKDSDRNERKRNDRMLVL